MKKIEITDKDSGITYIVDLSDADVSITGNVVIKPKDKPDEPEEPTLKCEEGPEPRTITNISTTSLLLGWHGKNVKGWDWWIQKGDAKVASGKIAPTSNKESINYPKLDPGKYTIYLQGNTCESDPKGLEFTIPDTGTKPPPVEEPDTENPPPVRSGKRSIIMALTGYGFDVEAPTGINKDWLPRIEAFLNLTHNGKTFRGIDAIRVNMKWYSYEPKEGTFRDDKLLDLINFCKQRGIKLNISIIPWRIIGDGMVDRSEWLEHLPDPYWQPSYPGEEQDLVWHAEGSLPSTEKTYIPSLHSATGREKFKKAVKHLAEFMARYPEYVDYIATATSPGEEYETNIQRASNNQILLSGYGQSDLNAWREYSGGIPVPYPQKNDEEHIAYLFNNSEAGRKWYEFRTKGLKDFHAAFVQGVRAGGKGKVRSMGMYAGVGAPSGTWTGLYKLNDIFSAGTSDQPDMMYSSEGDAGSQNSKLMATDLNEATFPGATRSIEFDPNDVSVDQTWDTSPDEDLNGEIYYYWAAPFFRRGGEGLHFAMAFPAAKINSQLGAAIYRLRAEFIDSDSGMTGIAQGDHFTFPITRYAGLQEFREIYSGRGGGRDKVVKITLTGTPV